jgi:DNA-binding MarR family transcriptional regulator
MADSDRLTQWELRILNSIRKEAKSEKKIAKDIQLNTFTTSQMITGLISKGYIERTMNKAKIRRYLYIEKFAVTHEGLSMLEEFASRNSPWNKVAEFIGQESYGLPFKMTIGAVRIVYRLVKFVLKP